MHAHNETASYRESNRASAQIVLWTLAWAAASWAAAAVAVNVLVGFAYAVANTAGLVTRDLDLALFPAMLGVVYMIAFVVGRLRYR